MSSKQIHAVCGYMNVDKQKLSPQACSDIFFSLVSGVRWLWMLLSRVQKIPTVKSFPWHAGRHRVRTRRNVETVKLCTTTLLRKQTASCEQFIKPNPHSLFLTPHPLSSFHKHSFDCNLELCCFSHVCSYHLLGALLRKQQPDTQKLHQDRLKEEE